MTYLNPRFARLNDDITGYVRLNSYSTFYTLIRSRKDMKHFFRSLVGLLLQSCGPNAPSVVEK